VQSEDIPKIPMCLQGALMPLVPVGSGLPWVVPQVKRLYSASLENFLPQGLVSRRLEGA
jgi:hypothetical protein